MGEAAAKQSAASTAERAPERPERQRVERAETSITRLHALAGNDAVRRLLARPSDADARLALVRAELDRPAAPLGDDVRADAERALGADVPPVRIHRSPRAADAVNATAFTVGNDIVLGDGVPPLDSPQGRRVLVHELAHVLQQRGAARSLSLVPPTAASERGAARGDASAPIGRGGLARVVTEKDLSRLDDAQLRAEYDLVTRELGRADGPDHDATVAYVQEIEQEVTRRSAAGTAAPSPSTAAPRCPCGGTIGPSGECDRCAAAQASEGTAAGDRATRVAQNERLLQDPTLSPADVLRLNRERNALLAGDVSSQLPPERDDASGASAQPQQVPVRVQYEAVPLDLLAGSAGGLGANLAGGLGPGSFAGGGDSELTDPAVSGGLGAAGNALQRFVDPLPSSGASTGPNLFTRFAGSGARNLTPELRTRLFSPSIPGADAFDRAGISWAQRIQLQQALRSRGAAAILAENGELAGLLRRVVNIHAVEGGVEGSPLLSLTELLQEEALTKLPEVATGRTYVVRVRIAPEDVIRVNEVLGRSGRTAQLANELEVVVAQDLVGRGARPRIVSITANTAENALLGGWRAGALRWGGRAMMVIGAGIAIHDVVTASGPHRREQEGRAFGSFAGATVLGALGAGFCVGAGIATGGIALALCGLAFGAAGGFGGGWLGGRVGSWFD